MSLALKTATNWPGELSITLSTAYTLEVAHTPTQITNKALDGTTYVQILGDPVTTYKLRAVIDTEEARTALDAAWANGTPINSEATSGNSTTITALGVITAVQYQGPLPGGKYLADIETAT